MVLDHKDCRIHLQVRTLKARLSGADMALSEALSHAGCAATPGGYGLPKYKFQASPTLHGLEET
jgi:hypothetical protein